MSEQSAKAARKSAYLLILGQVVIASIIALVFFLASDAFTAKSAFKGGLVAVIPNLVFAFFAFRFSAAENPNLVVMAFMRGQSLKLILSAVLLALVFSQQELVYGAFLTGFMLTLIAQWTAPVFFKH
ncbi:ATP synthase subunit I [Rheinheimera sp. MMS21-TC3]|uniref:ATP synthase subunit I n=1 Tax=Rheinheimera sp. MMS21-TC3 TaxID=3072790 RepID=UPI0028C3C4DA|nr:ATP synthase subunit I [Rheinheimera sp. MMS21-TC3]WNO59659.1 ATP synthase subunit I [Rheinheimera sp. MMS21-TC3]